MSSFFLPIVLQGIKYVTDMRILTDFLHGVSFVLSQNAVLENRTWLIHL